MGRLSTHVLDTVRGGPADGVRIDLAVATATGWRTLKSVTTNDDGRTPEPILEGDALKPGRYELVFHVADYFARRGTAQGTPPFLDEIPIRFTIVDPEANYHVPLIVTPWSYSTYRGS
ncbi:MAG TPA: hydroxyisourate hydrolase [Casimicrobiaceae bacterium]